MRAMAYRLFAVLLLLAGVSSAQAQGYPTQPIHMLVGFAPGGANDILARIVGQKLADSMGQPVVVENRPGASGLIAAEALAKAPADGYTLMLGSTGTQTMAPHLTRLHYDALNAFTPISLVGSTPNALVVRPTLPVQDVRELIEYAKTRPRLMTYASSGNGTTLHLAAVLFAMMADIDLIHVSYKGNAPALTDVMAGQVDMIFSALPPLLPLAKAGKLKILGVGSLERHRSAPDLPTLSEQGLPDYESGTWYGVFAPANLPAAVLDRLGVEIKKAIDERKVREQISAQGVDPKSSTPAEFRKYFREEYARWGAVIKKGNIKAD
jgi:tripartite-type tricarboxylate transporter receptor subunit TctC